MANWQGDVLKFHKKFGCHIEETPTIPDEKTQELRKSLIKEEVSETIKAIDEKNLELIADGIVDTIVVLLGTAVSYGIDIEPIWDEVHKTNMAKSGGGTREDGKILKPKNWQPPNIARLLEEQINGTVPILPQKLPNRIEID